jgi:hypothetical protein
MAEFISFYGIKIVEMAVYVLAISAVVAVVEKLIGAKPANR